MLATLTGDLCLLAGLAVLLLPLLATELSRPRDGVWGAVVLLLGLVLVTSNDRLRGAPMLAVACGALLIGRLGREVAQARWQQLSHDEQQRLGSRERWASSLQQLIAVVVNLGSNAGTVVASIKPSGPAAATREGASRSGKRWVRPETQSPIDNPQNEAATSGGTGDGATEGKAAHALTKPAGPDSDDPARNASPIPDGETTKATAPPQPTHKGFGNAKGKSNKGGKRWVRPETPAPSEQEPDTALKQAAPTPHEPHSTEHPEAAPPAGTGQD